MRGTRTAARDERRATTRYEIRVSRSPDGAPEVLQFAGQRALLEWVLGAVGPRALRAFVLEQLPDEQLTTQQAADLLGMSRPTLIKLVERGDLPHTLVGNRRYLPARAVEAFRLRHGIVPDPSAGRAPDAVIAANLRLLQRLAEEEGDCS